MTSNFDFVGAGWPQIAPDAFKAERYGIGDPRSSLFYSRRSIELFVKWLYKADASLVMPYKDDLSSLTFEPSFKRLVDQGIRAKIDFIRKASNAAVHRQSPITPQDAITVLRELYLVLVWIGLRYAGSDDARPVAGRQFDQTAIPAPQPGRLAKTMAEVQKLTAENERKDAELAEAERHSAQLEAELTELREQVAAAKVANALLPDPTDYKEDETRDRFIDLLLHEAGWALGQLQDREFPVTGMPNGNGTGTGTGFVDYVLWGEDGKPLGLVEAKRTRSDARVGQQQAKLYADALERAYGQRPVIFYSNGYEHFLWDDATYPPRRVDGFYTPDQLALLVQRRSSLRPFATVPTNTAIAERHYQERAIRKVAETFESHHERKALLVMATGSGKTRTVIALIDVLMRANRVKRVLFLADRIALVNQAVGAFKEHLPDAAPVNLVTEKDTEGRVYVSTYPTMMNLIDSGGDELRRFGPGHFDLIVIDEAHRSVYQKYGEIFGYFDALLVGLTATPKDEVDHNTYGLFQLEDGVPTDSYELAEAIADGYLVPPVARPISSGFMSRGIRYDDLTDAEKEQWDLLEWQDGTIPDEVDAAALNKWLFNADTVDKVLEVLMTEGRRVAGGDRLGKTIVFAKNTEHAQFIVDRFDANYPEYAGSFARVITYRSGPYVQSLIDDFGKPTSAPHIAVSVDMLDTGIDVPDVVNLVFFKPVHSKTKYWQMVGRGTRLRAGLYGPDADKTDFVIFDVCGNIEYFNQELPAAQPSSTRPLSQRLFNARIRVLGGLDARGTDLPDAERALRASLADTLRGVVVGMNRDNFLVRRHRRVVEHFADANAWTHPTTEELAAASDELSGLPSAALAADADEAGKRFDLLALRAQLGVLEGGTGFTVARDRIRAIADALGDARAIPAVAAQLELIDAVAGQEWWDGVTLPMLELMRTRLRSLVRLIDTGGGQAIVYTDFEDALGAHVPVDVVISQPGVDRVRFRDKLYAFLRAHADDIVMAKLRLGKQLTALDVDQLQRILMESGGFSADELAAEVEKAHGLGLLIRSLLGLDRAAASEALSSFVGDATLSANQIAFVDLVVEHLTARGSVPVSILYEAPFTDVAPTGPDVLFGERVVDLFRALRGVDATAVAGVS